MTTRKHIIQTTVVLIVLVIGVIFANTGNSAVTKQNTEELKRTITTLVRARNNVVLSHKVTANEEKPLTKDEEDFIIFLSYLDGRIYFYCQELFDQGSSTALLDTPCPTEMGNLETTQYSQIPDLSSQTKSEQINTLEDSFTASLGEFDEMLLKEQEQVASHIPRQSGAGSSMSSDDRIGAGDQSGQQPSTSQSGQKDKGKTSSQGAQVNGTDSSNRGTGSGSNSQSQRPPTSGNKDFSKTDDDIVARQLREAAEQETDPEVKAKLWEEYRKYKEGTS